MKKFKKVLIGLVGCIILFMVILKMPIKKAVKIDTKKISFEELTTKDTRIFCYCSPTVTGPKWTIVGKGNTRFTNFPEDDDMRKYIALEGNYPKRLDPYLTSSIFVLEGTYEPEKVDNDYKIKTFKVKKWDVLYPLRWHGDTNNSNSKDTITVKDYLIGTEWPSR